MSRYSRYDAFDDGNDMYNSRYDAGEFSTYGRSRGPTSGAYNNGRSSRSSPSRQFREDMYGYPMEGGYAGEQDLRRRMARYGESSSSYDDPRARPGRSSGSGYEAGRRSGLREQVYADDRQTRREQQEAQLEYQMQQQQQERERRRAGRDGFAGRSGRRGAVTGANDVYLAYMQAKREQQQREHDERPRNVQRYGRGYFPAYEFR
ncbi:hypothetical protein E8E11_007036 [Didymella keratinophila]|nr:hypothetical protein E8E11_007036 [Didymella keratinophila]